MAKTRFVKLIQTIYYQQTSANAVLLQTPEDSALETQVQYDQVIISSQGSAEAKVWWDTRRCPAPCTKTNEMYFC